jgi:hypothetical protein
MNLELYSRVFRVYDCDEFTRAFYSNEGVQLGASEPLPTAPYSKVRQMINFK